jgi:hypothetical protein
MIQVILCILILISIIIYNNLGLEQIENFEATGAQECNFDYTKKIYNTHNNCVIDCEANTGCVSSFCNTECDIQANTENQTRVNDLTKSDSVNIRAFSGNNGIKLTWVKPRTLFDIDKYYIILSSKTNNLLEVYILEDNSQLIDYFITGLDNDIIFNVFVIVKNKMGSISDPSNTESIMTRKESKLNLTRPYIGVGDSLETNNRRIQQSKVQQPLYSKNIVYNDIIQTLTTNLGFNPSDEFYNINIY